MNRIFKTIFNKARGTYVVTGENARAHGKTKSVKAAVAVTVLAVGGLSMNGALAEKINITAPIVVENYQEINNAILQGYVSKTAKDDGNDEEKGAIEVKKDSSIKITDSTFQNNENGRLVEIEPGKYDGERVKIGAAVLYLNKDATGMIENSTFSKNKDYYFDKTIGNESAGAIFNNGNLTVENTTFSENADNFQGGAINNYYDGTLTVSNSRFNNNGRYPAPGSDNRWGGAIINYGKMNDTDSTYTQNAAGTGGAPFIHLAASRSWLLKEILSLVTVRVVMVAPYITHKEP